MFLSFPFRSFSKAEGPWVTKKQAIFGLRTDLDLLVGWRYSFSSAIFYLGFIAGAYPAILMAQKYPVERVAALVTTLWGVCLMLTTVCHNYKALYAQRFFLGFLESGISPMCSKQVPLPPTGQATADRTVTSDDCGHVV